jgi:hypothetical protein
MCVCILLQGSSGGDDLLKFLTAVCSKNYPNPRRDVLIMTSNRRDVFKDASISVPTYIMLEPSVTDVQNRLVPYLRTHYRKPSAWTDSVAARFNGNLRQALLAADVAWSEDADLGVTAGLFKSVRLLLQANSCVPPSVCPLRSDGLALSFLWQNWPVGLVSSCAERTDVSHVRALAESAEAWSFWDVWERRTFRGLSLCDDDVLDMTPAWLVPTVVTTRQRLGVSSVPNPWYTWASPKVFLARKRSKSFNYNSRRFDKQDPCSDEEAEEEEEKTS